MADQDLVIQIKIDGSIQSSRDLKQVSADISKLKDSAERASKSTQALNMNFDSFSKGLIRTVFQVKNAIFVFVGLNLAIKGISNALIKPASDMEQFRVKLSALEGSAEKGRKRLEEFFNFAMKSPLNVKSVIDAGMNLEKFGLTATKVRLEMVQGMAVLGRAAGEGMESAAARMSTAFGKAMSGSLTSLRVLRDNLGLTKNKLMELGVTFEKNVPVKGLEEAINRYLQSRNIKSLTTALESTFEVASSNIKDALFRIMAGVGEPILGVLGPELKKVADYLFEIADQFRRGKGPAYDWALSIADNLKGLIKNFWIFSDVVTGVFNDIKNNAGIQFVSTFFQAVALSIQQALPYLATFGRMLIDIMNLPLKALGHIGGVASGLGENIIKAQGLSEVGRGQGASRIGWVAGVPALLGGAIKQLFTGLPVLPNVMDTFGQAQQAYGPQLNTGLSTEEELKLNQRLRDVELQGMGLQAPSAGGGLGAGRVRDNTTDVMRKQLQLARALAEEQARSYELQGRELQGEKLREAVLQKEYDKLFGQTAINKLNVEQQTIAVRLQNDILASKQKQHRLIMSEVEANKKNVEELENLYKRLEDISNTLIISPFATFNERQSLQRQNIQRQISQARVESNRLAIGEEEGFVTPFSSMEAIEKNKAEIRKLQNELLELDKQDAEHRFSIAEDLANKEYNLWERMAQFKLSLGKTTEEQFLKDTLTALEKQKETLKASLQGMTLTEELSTALKNSLTEIDGKIKDTGNKLTETLTKPFAEMREAGIKAFGDILSSILSGKGSFTDALKGGLQTIIGGSGQWLTKLFKGLGDMAGPVAGVTGGVLSSLAGLLGPKNPGLADAEKNQAAVFAQIDALREQVKAVVSNLQGPEIDKTEFNKIYQSMFGVTAQQFGGGKSGVEQSITFMQNQFETLKKEAEKLQGVSAASKEYMNPFEILAEATTGSTKTILTGLVSGLKGGNAKILDFFKSMGTEITNAFDEAAKTILPNLNAEILKLAGEGIFKTPIDFIMDIIKEGGDKAKQILQIFNDKVNAAMTGAVNGMQSISVFQIIRPFASPDNPFFRLLGSMTEGALNVPSFAAGGIMPHTGLAYLHKNETIIPSGKGGGFMVGTVNLTINGVRNAEDVPAIFRKAITNLQLNPSVVMSG